VSAPIITLALAVGHSRATGYTKELRSTRESEGKPMLVTCMDEAQHPDMVCKNILTHHEQGTLLMH
jgi:hypothetical protein